jgi:cyclophilin family peptidyl-prolyl cis-trans isomerase
MKSALQRLAACMLAALCIIGIPFLVQAESDPPFSLPPRQELIKLRSGMISTTKGNIYFELYPEDAPWHVANLKYLADRGFYRNIPFHLFEAGYYIQTGAPHPPPTSGPGYELPAEFNQHKHQAGTLSMVRRPDDLDLDHGRRSHGSQFRIMLRPARPMDGQYTVFGQVVKGMEVVDQLRLWDVVKDVKVFVRKEP